MNAQRLAMTTLLAERFGQIGKERRHLVRRLQPMVRGQPLSFLHPDLNALLDAQQNVVALVLMGLEEVHVVGRDERQVQGKSEIDQRGLDLILVGEVVTHQLNIETPIEGFGQTLGNRGRKILVSLKQSPADRPLGPTGQQDQIA